MCAPVWMAVKALERAWSVGTQRHGLCGSGVPFDVSKSGLTVVVVVIYPQEGAVL